MNTYKFKNIETGETIIIASESVRTAIDEALTMSAQFAFVCQVGL